jgi:hypothetical protein
MVMKLRYLAAGLGCALAGVAFAGSALAFTAITSQWDEITMSQDICLERAEDAIRAAGFKALPHTLQSRHGYSGEYTVAIRCMAEVHVVFFMVAGPSRKVTPKYMDKVHGHF